MRALVNGMSIPASIEQRFFDLLGSQHGAGAVAQAYHLGMPKHRVDLLVRRGVLERPRPGIVAMRGAPDTYRRRAMMGVLTGGHGTINETYLAAVCGMTAAFILDLTQDPPEPIEILTARRLDPRDGYRFRRTSRIPASEILTIDGIPCTDPIRTFIDICDSAPPRALTTYYRAMRKGLLTPQAVLKRCEEESRQGRGGLVRAREIAQGTTQGAERARSQREEEVYRWIVEAGLPAPERNYLVQSSFGWKWQIDLFYPNDSVGVEVSPYWWHGDPEIREKDNMKRLDLASMGITIIEATDRTQPYELIRALRPRLSR